MMLRIAQLMQDEEFLTRLARDPEFSQALAAEIPPEEADGDLTHHRVSNLKSGQ